MMNFKPSAWWFGLVPLLRGPLISVPAVIATDQPGVNLALMFQVLLVPLAQENTCGGKKGGQQKDNNKKTHSYGGEICW